MRNQILLAAAMALALDSLAANGEAWAQQAAAEDTIAESIVEEIIQPSEAAKARKVGAWPEICFDKTTLTYFNCNEPAPKPEMEAEETAEPENEGYELIRYSDYPEGEYPEDSGFYFGVKGGFGHMNNTAYLVQNLGSLRSDFDTLYAISGQMGYEFAEFIPNTSLRLEAEIGYQSASVNDNSITEDSSTGTEGRARVLYMGANAYMDLALLEKVDWIFGGGFSFGRAAFNDVATGTADISDSHRVYGLNINTGFSYDIMEHISLDATYRYMIFHDAQFETSGGNSAKSDLISHQGLLGLRYKL